MQHLMLEALARLVDEPPDAEEAAHLADCEVCRAELEGMRRETAALGRLGPIDAGAEAWDSLAGRLESERLIGGAARRPWGRHLLRLAAALALYGVGTATGLALRSRPAPSAPAPAGAPAVATQPTTSPVAAAEPASTPAEPGPSSAEPAPSQGNASFASNGTGRLRPLPDDVAEANTPDAALQAVHAAERRYLQAYARYSELTSTQGAEDPVARVAALESIVLTTRQALDRAPADPVINGYHLTAVAQRDAALRQIALRSNGPWF